MGATEDVRRIAPGVVADLRAGLAFVHLDEWDRYTFDGEFVPEREIERAVRHCWARAIGSAWALREIIVVQDRFAAGVVNGQ
jgi:hypothetical protein